MQEDPRASRKTLAARAKGTVAEVDILVYFEECRVLSVQGQTARQFETDLHICGPKLFTSPDHVMHFALNPGTDTLLHTPTCTCGGRSHHPSASCVLTSRPFSMCSITAVWLWRDGATTRTTMTFFGTVQVHLKPPPTWPPGDSQPAWRALLLPTGCRHNRQQARYRHIE